MLERLEELMDNGASLEELEEYLAECGYQIATQT